MTVLADAFDDPFRRPRRRRRPAWIVWAALGAAVLGIVLLLVLRGPSVTEHERERKTINVVLPPPPPPPPPEVKPEETPPEPKPTPIEQPEEPTPPPPEPQEAPSPEAAPTVGDSALTAREGAGPSNYGLARGDGGGTRIGGTAGGAGRPNYAPYASSLVSEIQRACAGVKGRYTAQLMVKVAADGVIQGVDFERGSGDERRDRAIRACVSGHQMSQRPPAGLPPVRIEFTSRPGL